MAVNRDFNNNLHYRFVWPKKHRITTILQDEFINCVCISKFLIAEFSNQINNIG